MVGHGINFDFAKSTNSKNGFQVHFMFIKLRVPLLFLMAH